MSQLLNLLQAGPTPKNLSLQGRPGPVFEALSQRTTSKIQAKVTGTALDDSEDLLTGRTIAMRGLTGPYVTPESDPPVSNPNARVGKPYFRVLNAAGSFINPYPNTNTYLGG
jgi:hypothetical protein